MSVLVTGGAGYIGGHMALGLMDAGETVVILDNLSTGFAWAAPPGAKLVVGDTGDAALVARLIKEHGIDAIAHFAAKIVVPESIQDPLGYYLGGWGYAYLQVLGEAVEGAKSINDDKLADYLHNNEFKTIMGSWRYGPNGEWTKSGFLEVQYHDIKEGAGLETWRGMSYQTVLTPAEHRTGDVIYPYEKAK